MDSNGNTPVLLTCHFCGKPIVEGETHWIKKFEDPEPRPEYAMCDTCFYSEPWVG